jgi:hypothetical protein
MMAMNCMAKNLSDLRNTRYCELLFVHGISSIEVYSTVGLNDCPDEKWKRLDKESLKKKFNVYSVVLNGPRYWVFDRAETHLILETKFLTVSGLGFQLVANLKNVLFVLLKNKKPYQEVEVSRQTVWIYEPNKPIYELIAPNGSVYLMQSYSVHKKTQQTLTSLSTLGTQLQLPKGWTYKTGTIQKELRVPTENNTAIVLQDDIENTYQRIERDVLN